MKLFKTILCGAMVVAGSLSLAARDCDLSFAVVDMDPDQSDAPAAMSRIITSRLINALNADGQSAGDAYGQLYMSGRFADTFKETVPGPPMQTAVTTELTLYVADIFSDKVFDSETFQLKGVGTSEQKAYMNALSNISGKNEAFKKFVKRAANKTVAYFDKNYEQLLSKARTAAAQHDYDKALYYTTLIPQCSVGYAAAESATMQYFQAYADYEGQQLLTQAKGIFSASPNAEGARRAFELISRINPSSKSYAAAMKYTDEMAKQTKAEYDFEVHQKYKDKLAQQNAIIDAARQVGVAYGRGQKATTTNIIWR